MLLELWGFREIWVMKHFNKGFQFSSVQLLSRVRLFETPCTAAHQASLSITDYQSLLKLLSIGLVMPFNHLILCYPFLLLPSIFAIIRVFANGKMLGLVLFMAMEYTW